MPEGNNQRRVTVQAVELEILKRDMTLIIKFQAWCNLKRKKRFCADDFRNYLKENKKSLDDPEHSFGRIFRTILVTGQGTEVGWVRSTYPRNHKRKIRELEWTQ